MLFLTTARLTQSRRQLGCDRAFRPAADDVLTKIMDEAGSSAPRGRGRPERVASAPKELIGTSPPRIVTHHGLSDDVSSLPQLFEMEINGVGGHFSRTVC